ncbi:DUF3131 domain-containing protein [Nostoc sp. HG1]|nr:DUF3131 domain-containing protein [Nostoc sp. HG1]
MGWSALDVGRALAAFDVIRPCHPQYNDWLKRIVAKWQVARSPTAPLRAKQSINYP